MASSVASISSAFIPKQPVETEVQTVIIQYPYTTVANNTATAPTTASPTPTTITGTLTEYYTYGGIYGDSPDFKIVPPNGTTLATSMTVEWSMSNNFTHGLTTVTGSVIPTRTLNAPFTTPTALTLVQSSSATASPASVSGGLSPGGKAGIGVGISAAVVFLALIVALWAMRNRRLRHNAEIEDSAAGALHDKAELSGEGGPAKDGFARDTKDEKEPVEADPDTAVPHEMGENEPAELDGGWAGNEVVSPGQIYERKKWSWEAQTPRVEEEQEGDIKKERDRFQ